MHLAGLRGGTKWAADCAAGGGDFSLAEEVGAAANPVEESFVRAEALEQDAGSDGVRE